LFRLKIDRKKLASIRLICKFGNEQGVAGHVCCYLSCDYVLVLIIVTYGNIFSVLCVSIFLLCVYGILKTLKEKCSVIAFQHDAHFFAHEEEVAPGMPTVPGGRWNEGYLRRACCVFCIHNGADNGISGLCAG